MLKHLIIVSLILTAVVSPTRAQDTYKIGLTGAITSSFSPDQAPAIDAMRLYFDRLNAKGGINGRRVELILTDDSAEPSRAAANAKKLITEDNVVLIVLSSLSSTYAPVIAEAKRGGVPLIYGASVCPKQVYPPADDLQFCTTSYSPNYDSLGVLAFVKELGTEPIKLGVVASALPITRAEIDFATAQAKTMNIRVVDSEVIPPPTPDYTPFATKLKGADPNWIFAYATSHTVYSTFVALRRLGWRGNYISAAMTQGEDQIEIAKDPNFFLLNTNTMFNAKLPVHQEIADLAKAGGSSYPPNQMADGWVNALVVEAALRATAWPPTRSGVKQTLSHLKVDTKGLREGPLEWTGTNHFRTVQYYRMYHWDSEKSAIVAAGTLKKFDVK